MRSNLISVAMTVGIVLTSCTATGSGVTTTSGDPDVGIEPAGAAAPQPDAAPTTATSTPSGDLGLADLVDQYMRWGWTLPSHDAATQAAAEPPAMQALSAARGTRTWFEKQIFVAFAEADRLIPSDNANLPAASPAAIELRRTQLLDFEACFVVSGHPSAAELASLSPRERKALILERGFTKEREAEQADLCWAKTHIRWGRDATTDRLLGELSTYYLKVAEKWVEANPDLAVPIPAAG